MANKRSLLILGGVALIIIGLAAWGSACPTCGCWGAKGAKGAKPAKTAVTTTPPFTVLDVTGPAKGQKLCYICRYGGSPSFVVFTRRTDGHVQHLAKAIDTFVAENKKARVRAFVVFLGENNKANRDKLAGLAKAHNLTIPLTIAATGTANPKGYNLPKSFDTLVLVTRRNKVHSTIAVNCAKDACGCTKCAKVADVLDAGKHLLGDHS